ncbi:cyd operon YbgE family protein [Aidingimonas lacisalsi]|uniref:cyd operon YbgE family protein n=1 Tax=Aidingimonas lacisalsi TaxID=2604086 RepID=UPI0011D28EEC|nr:cyd operon YbgE family protein [Aidingimonas lacisalsi]
MEQETIDKNPWLPLATMGVSAVLALWLLWRPELLSALGMPLRVPAILLGVWALGAGFMYGMGLRPVQGWCRRLLGAPTCWWVLGAFTLLLMWRA